MLVRATLAAAFIGASAIGASAGTASAQSVPVWPVELDEVVGALVAEEWSVDADDVVVEWGSAGSSIPEPEASVELLGSGSSGHWVARFQNPDGGSLSRRLRAGHSARRAVAARRITRGSILSPDDIQTTESFVWGPPIEVDAPVQEGWVVQRVLDEGEPLEIPAVRAPFLVTSGAPVDVVWHGGSVRVRVAGTAGGSGGLGDQVRIRTANGNRMMGVIVAPGVVDVTRAAARITRGGKQ